MNSRKEIEDRKKYRASVTLYGNSKQSVDYDILEVLLDIRDLLSIKYSKSKRKHKRKTN